MIEYLEQLVKDGKYREALALAEQILRDGVEDAHDLLTVYTSQMIAHGALESAEDVLVSGELAMALARDLEEWDSFGTSALNLGAAYARLNRHEDAIERCYEYIAHLGQYRDASRYESLVWYNLGLSYGRLERHDDAAKALSQALAVAERTGTLRYKHGVRQALAEACIKSRQFERVPRLLAQSAAYLRNHPDANHWLQSWVAYMMLRAEYAFVSGRWRRARAVALRGLQRTEGEPVYQCRFHVILARVALSQGTVEDAVAHGLAARSCAVRSGRPDVEEEATGLLYSITSLYPHASEVSF